MNALRRHVLTLLPMAAALALVTGPSLYHELRMRWLGAASAAWPHASGTVVAAAVMAAHEPWLGTADYRPLVMVTYTVGHDVFTTDRVCFGPPGCSDGTATKWVAERIVARYPSGCPVEVAYDPSNPKRAVLEPGVVGAAGHVDLTGLACGGVFLALLLLGVSGNFMACPVHANETGR